MKIALLYFTILLTLTSFSQEVDMLKQKKDSIIFQDMPEEVQIAINNSFRRDTTDQGKIYISGAINNEFINLDPRVKFKNESIRGKAGVRPGVQIFNLNGAKFYFSWNGNRENPPFVFYQYKIYYKIGFDMIYSEETIKSAHYEVIDISKYLKR